MRAISSVSRPPSVRNVSATCASGQRQVATGEDQTKPVIWYFFGVVIRFCGGGNEFCERFNFSCKRFCLQNAVNGFVFRRLNDPCPRRVRHRQTSTDRQQPRMPPADSSGNVKIAKLANQNAATIKPQSE